MPLNWEIPKMSDTNSPVVKPKPDFNIPRPTQESERKPKIKWDIDDVFTKTGFKAITNFTQYAIGKGKKLGGEIKKQFKEEFPENMRINPQAVFELAKSQAIPMLTPEKIIKQTLGVHGLQGHPTLNEMGTIISGVSPRLWLYSLMAAPAIKIQEAASSEEVLASVPITALKKIRDIVNDTALDAGLKVTPFNRENVNRAKWFGDVWGNTYSSVTGTKAPEWLKATAGMLQIIGLSPSSREFKSAMRKLPKVAKTVSKGLQSTAQGIKNVSKGIKLDYIDFLKGKTDRATFIAKHGKAKWETMRKLARAIDKESAAYGAETTSPEYVAKRLFGTERVTITKPAASTKGIDKFSIASDTVAKKPIIQKSTIPGVERRLSPRTKGTDIEQINHAIASLQERFDHLSPDSSNYKHIAGQTEVKIHNLQMRKQGLIDGAEAKAKIEIPKFKHTEDAEEFGKTATLEQANEMKRLYEVSKGKTLELIKQDKMNEALISATEGQLYRESFQAAPALHEKYYDEFLKFGKESLKRTPTQLTEKLPIATSEYNLEGMLAEIKAGKAGENIFDEEGKFLLREESSFPEWFKGEGLLKKESVGILEKAIKGEKLTVGQQEKLETLIELTSAANKEYVEAFEESEVKPVVVEEKKIESKEVKPSTGKVIESTEPSPAIVVQQELEILKKNSLITDFEWNKILKKNNVINKETKKWRKIIPDKIKNIQRAIHKASVLAKIHEPTRATIRKDIKIERMYVEAGHNVETKQPNVVDSRRYWIQKVQSIIKRPLFDLFRAITDDEGENLSRIKKILTKLMSITPESKKLVRDKKSLERIRQYIGSKSQLKNKPEEPKDITRNEVLLADGFIDLYKNVEIMIRHAELYEHILYDKPLSKKKTHREGIKKAITLANEHGFYSEQLLDFLKTQEWGVVGSGFEPLESGISSVDYRTIDKYGVSKSHIQQRVKIEYSDQERNIYQRTLSYLKQIHNLYYTQPKIDAMTDIFNENVDKFKNPRKTQQEFKTYITSLKGFYPDSNHPLVKIMTTVYAQASRGVILSEPVLVFRNWLQNIGLAPDKLALIDIRNKPMTEEDEKYFKTYVSNTYAILEQFLLQGESGFPGLRGFNRIVDAIRMYPMSDNTNRRWLFGATTNKLRRFHKKHNNIEAFKKLSEYKDLEPLEQQHALGIFATKGIEDFIRYVSRVHTDNVHLLYARTQRSALETGSKAAEIGTNLWLFSRAYWERMAKNAYRVTGGKGGKVPVASRWRALQLIFSIISGSMVANKIYMEVTGRGKGPYNPLNLALFRPGGLAVGSIQTLSEPANLIMEIIFTRDEGARKRALGKLPALLTTVPDMFVPYYDVMTRTVEAATGTKNLDRLAIRKLRTLIDKEYTVRGGAYKVKRTTLDAWKYGFGGAGIDYTNKKKAAEAAKSGWGSKKNGVQW